MYLKKAAFEGGIKMEFTQEEKAMQLQQAVLNNSVEELRKICDALGEIEMPAPALGLACRFRGLDIVKVLVEKGATFDFPSTKKIEERYHCYIGKKYGNYRTNYAMYLLKIFGENSRIFCINGMTMERSANTKEGRQLPFLSDEKRVDVLKYLLENREKIAFQPEELLFYAIYFKDTAIVKELKTYNIKLSKIRVQKLTEGAIAMDGYWFEYVLLTEQLADSDYLEIMQQIAAELDGKQFYFTWNIYQITKKRFCDLKIFEFFLAQFKQEKMNKIEMIRDFIEQDQIDALPIIEREGWLNVTKRRDEIIAYASENNKTEMLSWILDFKNRTADFAAEQERADKKLMRELNAAPNSVTALKKIWNYKKEENGTLTITNYKGTEFEVTVPEKIGKGVVAAIGKGAFSGSYYNGKVTAEQIEHRCKITKIILPETVHEIRAGAFFNMKSLVEINIPEGVSVIEEEAFGCCRSLKHLTLPKSLEKIGARAFYVMEALKQITIPDGVCEIGEEVFANCNALRKLIFSNSLKKIGKLAFAHCQKLEEIHIGESVEEIGASAFYGCVCLKNIMIPGTVTNMKKYMFYECSVLESVQIREGVQEMDDGVFFKCPNLKVVFVPKSVQHLITKKYGARKCGVFEECPNLTVVCPKKSKMEEYCIKKGLRFRNNEDLESNYFMEE